MEKKRFTDIQTIYPRRERADEELRDIVVLTFTMDKAQGKSPGAESIFFCKRIPDMISV